MNQPEVGDIWVWRGLEHYLLLQREKISRNVFTAIYLEKGELAVLLPIDPREKAWKKTA